MCHTMALCMQLYLRCLHPSQLRGPTRNDAPPQQNRSWARVRSVSFSLPREKEVGTNVSGPRKKSLVRSKKDVMPD